MQYIHYNKIYPVTSNNLLLLRIFLGEIEIKNTRANLLLFTENCYLCTVALGSTIKTKGEIT